MSIWMSIHDNSRGITFGWGQMNACCISVPHPKDNSYKPLKEYIHFSTLPHKIMCRLGGYFNDNYCYYKRQIERIIRKYNNIAPRLSKRMFLSNIAIYASNILRFYAYLAKNILRFYAYLAKNILRYQKKVVPLQRI